MFSLSVDLDFVQVNNDYVFICKEALRAMLIQSYLYGRISTANSWFQFDSNKHLPILITPFFFFSPFFFYQVRKFSLSLSVHKFWSFFFTYKYPTHEKNKHVSSLSLSFSRSFVYYFLMFMISLFFFSSYSFCSSVVSSLWWKTFYSTYT